MSSRASCHGWLFPFFNNRFSERWVGLSASLTTRRDGTKIGSSGRTRVIIVAWCYDEAVTNRTRLLPQNLLNRVHGEPRSLPFSAMIFA
ncbi:hypothetical protein FXO09_02445 [Microcystis aeruginosa KLA2]|uniref:Uncharacterized protein n=1 Tax=Microcystis aeruginosa Ma_QC_B_20070730_S2 TaxID=2486256 RepID=A0A552DWA1_MICAE|nr:MAG: hypothetical protein EWV62_05535 [Microcystis aeruginosa Ma_OC_LR_19540900_S633]TRU26510.1 MAG: hypothetical protein EWV80_08200 [Microcystis aeruginosa Ma_QC_B_20070730_S2]TYT72674.1 hypothetical protein FXO09_02445 [Microcystis aeruginosa KLA2]